MKAGKLQGGKKKILMQDTIDIIDLYLEKEMYYDEKLCKLINNIIKKVGLEEFINMAKYHL